MPMYSDMKPRDRGLAHNRERGASPPRLSGRQQGRDLERDYFKPSREQEERGARFADAVGLSEGRRGGGRLAGRLELDAQRHQPYSRPSSARRDVVGGGFRRERRGGGGSSGGGGGSGGFRGRGRDGGGSNGQREPNKRSTPEDLDKAMDSYWNSDDAEGRDETSGAAKSTAADDTETKGGSD